MNRDPEKMIFSRTDPADFVGRTAELGRLLRHASGESVSNGLALLAAPMDGSSELMRQVYDRLFLEQDEIVPFLFELRASDGTARNAAMRFLHEFLLQTVAFRRRDAKIMDASPEVCEIAELAVPADGHWIDRLIETCHSDSKLNNDRAFIRNCLSAPLRPGSRVFVMIDDLHAVAHLEDGGELLEDLINIYTRSNIRFVFAGKRRFLFPRTTFETMRVAPLSFEEAGKLVEQLAAGAGLSINDQTRDLIAVQLGGSAQHITSLFVATTANAGRLDSFERVEQAYLDEIFGGRIANYLDATFDRILPDKVMQKDVLRLLSETMSAPSGKISLAYWHEHAGMKPAEMEAVLKALHRYEIINIGSGFVEVETENILLGDYLRGRTKLEIESRQRALAVGETLSEYIKRAPQLMARFYRRRSTIEIRELMLSFDGRNIPAALIDYGKFSDQLKGVDDERISEILKDDNEKVSLPRIVYAAHTAGFYPMLNEICDVERSAVGFGFSDAAEKEEVVWIAAVIDSKLEATRELAEFWCDRLEMVALHCNFSRFQIWLVAPEGFTADAISILRERNAYGSSRKQAELLAGNLGAAAPGKTEKAANEYEIVLPMGEDTEMIAAHALDDIAKRHGLPPKATNQLKTALVEACINATEHSLSPDRRIYQKFAVDHDKITITISNRGLRLADKTEREVEPDESRRGWGLKLMQGLVDDVKIAQTDDGTRITMVKYFKAV